MNEKDVSTLGGGAPKDSAPKEEGGGLGAKAVEKAPENKAIDHATENK